ncbi:MAG: hypothetical protein FWG84_04850 [Bacteroidales bacterium]|nr:hypothetical protein [Bacteroidales bacterium]
MEQKDYLLREIEKIGVIINAIRKLIFGGNGNLTVTLENHVENAKGMLLNELDFDFDAFLLLSEKESNEYIANFTGFSVENVELLAECVSEIGFNDKSDNSKKYFEKALQLYNLCNLKSATYSYDRETKISAIKNMLATD